MRPGRQLRLGCYATAVGLGFSLPGLARAQRVAIAEVVVSPTDAWAPVGRMTQFFATAFDRADNALSSVTSFTWRSSNPRVATVDANGVATGLSPGITLITARIGSGRSVKTSQPATLVVVLGESVAPQSSSDARVIGSALQIATPRFALPVGERRTLTVQLLDTQRRPIGMATELRWRSSDTLVARVVGGSAMGIGMGHARLVAYASWDSTVAADVYVVGDMIVAGLSDGMWNLYMAQSRGGARPRTLTRDSALKFAPTWSAGLTRIAYIVEPDPRILVSDLWVANVDGSGARRLTDDSARVASPSFVGPSGDRIVFASARGGLPQLYIVNLDGTARRALTTGENPSMDPDVSPDGAKLLYASERDRNGDIYEMNLDGTGERRLTTDPQYEDSPVYAPDGKSFYYIRHESSSPPSSRVFRQDLATGVAVPVTPGGILVRAFSVSADGRTLAITVIMLDSHAVPHVELLDLLTGTRAPLMLPGVEQMAGAAFRPPVPAPH